MRTCSRGQPAKTDGGSRWPSGCGRGRWRNSWGRGTCSEPANCCDGRWRRRSSPRVILWGPPGTGKTTLGRLLAAEAKARFVPVSAVMAGVKELREAVAEAAIHRDQRGERTVLFVDEIHRFNKAQQDALLPHVEARHGGSDRRHDREPVLRGQRRAAVAREGGRAASADRGGSARGDRSRADRHRARPGRKGPGGQRRDPRPGRASGARRRAPRPDHAGGRRRRGGARRRGTARARPPR